MISQSFFSQLKIKTSYKDLALRISIGNMISRDFRIVITTLISISPILVVYYYIRIWFLNLLACWCNVKVTLVLLLTTKIIFT